MKKYLFPVYELRRIGGSGNPRKEQLTSYTWACAKHLVLSHMATLSPNWKDMDVMVGPVGG